MDEKQYWKILEFGSLVGKHYNTVDKWFREVEKKGIHYVQRVEVGESEEKVYDELDLQIGQFIVAKREQKWSLDAIFDSLPDEFDLRPFPEGKRIHTESQVIDIEALKKELTSYYHQAAVAMVDTMKETLREEIRRELLQSLPQPLDYQVERQYRLTEHITQRRIESKLEQEALAQWVQLPEDERMKKVGLFRKEENRDKRDQFVRTYINERYEQRLKQEYES